MSERDIRQHSFSSDSGTWLDRLIRSWRSVVVRRRIPKGASVCDLGCGYEAKFLQEIYSLASRRVGVDLEVGAPKEKHIEVYEQDLNQKLPFRDDEFDVVTSLAVLEHLLEPERYLAEARRILKPGGVLILTTPSPLAAPILETLAFFRLIDRDEIHDHKKYFGKNELTLMAREAGFQKTEHSYFEFGLNNLVVAQK